MSHPDLPESYRDGDHLGAADVNAQNTQINALDQDNADDVEPSDLAAGLAGKLDKINQPTRVLITDGNGQPDSIGLSTSVVGSSIPKRGSSSTGGTLKAGAAKEEDDLVQRVQLMQMQALSPTPYAAGQHYHCNSVGSAATSAALGFSGLRLSLWVVPHPVEIAALGIETTVIGSNTATFKIAVYSLGSNASPKDLLFEGISLPMDAPVGYQFDETPDLELPPGLYWVGGALQGSGTQPTLRTVNALGTPQIQLPLGTGTPLVASVVNNWARGNTPGALPNPASNFGVSGTLPPRVTFRVAA